MSSWTVIPCSQDQINKIFDEYIKGVKNVKYSNVDGIGFCSGISMKKDKFCFQLREDKAMFFELQKREQSLRYDISYPWQVHKELGKILSELGIMAKKEFWKGGSL